MSDKYSNIEKNRRYPWEIGTRLADEVRARDMESAMESIHFIFNVINAQSSDHGLDKVRLRMLQAISIANRAAYDAGANPEQLFHLNLDIITDLPGAENRDQILSIAKNAVADFIYLVPERDILNDKKLSKALTFMSEHCTENLSRKSVAEILNCSPVSLSRLFSKELGRSFKDEVLKFRIDRAKKLLHENGKTVTNVAFEVGYRDPNYFIATFRRVTGITPGQYRRKIPGSNQ
jgi:YesN/AraC family two-component response regulator